MIKVASPQSRAARQWAVKQLIYEEFLEQIDHHFSRLGIRYMPIKGAYLILSGLAGKVEGRSMVDVDILVEERDYQRVIAYFSSLPGCTAGHDLWYFETPFDYGMGDTTVHFELHYLLNRPERFLLPTELLFLRAQAPVGFRYLPCTEDALLIHLTHVLVHISYWFVETAVPEVGILANTADFSWKRFWTYAQKTGISRFLYCMVRLCEKSGAVRPDYNGRSVYAEMICHVLKFVGYSNLPRPLRRLLLEVPFVRSPLKLIGQNLRPKKVNLAPLQ